MASSQTFEDELEACIKVLLGKEYPFTKTSVINQVASASLYTATAEIVRLKIVDAAPGVRALDFLNLPAELRNRIYEYVVISDKDGKIDLHTWHQFSWSFDGLRQSAMTKVNR